MTNRKRKVWSYKEELLVKSRESMLNAVQIFNNPNIQFKSESFIVLSNIAWMYLLHAYYKSNRIEYRYFRMAGTRRRYDRTKRGAYKYWELERCINTNDCPVDQATCSNLKFLIGLRHEIEHQMTTKIDEYLSARFQACCLNFNSYIKELFGESYGIDKHLSISLQFSSINEEQVDQLREFNDLPANIASYIDTFDGELSEEEYNDIRFSYRVLFIPKTVNRKGQADRVIEFIRADSPEAEGLNKEYVMIKEKERKKYLPTNIIQKMHDEGFIAFNMHHHTQLWKNEDAKNTTKGLGVLVAKQWYWYEQWIDIVSNHCTENNEKYS